MDINLKNIIKKKKIPNFKIFDNFPDSIIIINSNKSVVYANKAAQSLIGFTTKELFTKNVNEIFDDYQDTAEKASLENKNAMLYIITAYGKKIPTEISCSFLSEEKDIIISIRDISKIQKIIENLIIKNENAEKISHNKSSFIAGLSNELISPLHSIIGFSQALLDKLGGELSEKQIKYINIISKNSNTLLSLLNSMTDLSKIEAGQMEFNFKTFDVFHLLNSVAYTITPAITEKKLQFSQDIAESVRKNICSDENMLRQILLNLLSNSIKFTGHGSINLKVFHPELDFVKHKGMDAPIIIQKSPFCYFPLRIQELGLIKIISMQYLMNIGNLTVLYQKNMEERGLAWHFQRKLSRDLVEMSGWKAT